MLSEAGATSFAFAATQADAVAQARAVRPSIIISDGRLIKGTGPAAVQDIRRHLGRIPVLFVSGTPDDGIAREPGDPVFGKPLDHALIAATFRRIVRDGAPA